MPSRSSANTAWVLRPIDELYHVNRSKTAQMILDPTAVVADTLEAASILCHSPNVAMIMVTLMKIFVMGDREGQNPELSSTQELFWDDRVSTWIDYWLDRICADNSELNLTGLDEAWQRSSDHIRQVQVPFYQFYQAFVAQYAAVSIGHHGFARTLVLMNHFIDEVDYRHLLWSDHGDVLRTLRVSPGELPSSPAAPEHNEPMLRIYLRMVVDHRLERQEGRDALYRFALGQLRHCMQYASDLLRKDIETNLLHAADESIRRDWESTT